MIIDCISDLHGDYPGLTGGDLLIVAGDLTRHDDAMDHYQALEWLLEQPYTKKVLIAGNHDNFLMKHPDFYSKKDIIYLCDSGTEFEGLKIWGSPWTVRFSKQNPRCCAFTKWCADETLEIWEKVPSDTDILVTHGPPFGILDSVSEEGVCKATGDFALRDCLEERLSLKLQVFGHVHEEYGYCLFKGSPTDTWCVNASRCDVMCDPVNEPIRVHYENGRMRIGAYPGKTTLSSYASDQV